MKKKTLIGLEYIAGVHTTTLAEVARQLGVSRQVVHSWVRGQSKIPPARVEELSSIFNLPSSVFGQKLDVDDKIHILELTIENLKDLSRLTED